MTSKTSASSVKATSVPDLKPNEVAIDKAKLQELVNAANMAGAYRDLLTEANDTIVQLKVQLGVSNATIQQIVAAKPRTAETSDVPAAPLTDDNVA